MKTITGNILDVKSGVILHCTNCQDAMGKGVAKALYEKWPLVKEQYHSFNKRKRPLDLLGEFDTVYVEDGISVINVYGQLDYCSTDGARRFHEKGQRYVDYGACKIAFNAISHSFRNVEFFFPYLFGCGLAGGDWSIMSELIEIYFPNATIIKLPS